MFERLNSHTVLFLLRNCFAIPKMTYLIRTSPAWKFRKFMVTFNNAIKNVFESILNIKMNHQQWTQVFLPISFGGLGIRKLEDVALPAFISSSCGVESHVSRILNFQDKTFISHFDEALDEWRNINGPLFPDCKIIQKNWDLINIQRIIEDLKFESKTDIARFKALQCKESNAWLHSIPSPNIGTFIDNNCLRICVSLRLGCKICLPHAYVYVDLWCLKKVYMV